MFLLFANVAGLVSEFVFGLINPILFDCDKEYNIPALYSSLALLLSRFLSGAISFQHKKAHV